MRICLLTSLGISLELKQGRFKEWTCVCERKPEKHSEPSAVQQLAVEWVNEKGRKGRLVKVQPADDGWMAHSHCTKQLLLSIWCSLCLHVVCSNFLIFLSPSPDEVRFGWQRRWGDKFLGLVPSCCWRTSSGRGAGGQRETRPASTSSTSIRATFEWSSCRGSRVIIVFSISSTEGGCRCTMPAIFLLPYRCDVMQVIKLSYEDPMPSLLQMCCSFLKVYTYAKLNFDPVSVVVPQRTGEAGLLAEQKSQSIFRLFLVCYSITWSTQTPPIGAGNCGRWPRSKAATTTSWAQVRTPLMPRKASLAGSFKFQVLVTMPARERALQAHWSSAVVLGVWANDELSHDPWSSACTTRSSVQETQLRRLARGDSLPGEVQFTSRVCNQVV